MATNTPRKTIGVVLKGYPRLSETFIAQEILELERRGFNLVLISLRYPTDRHRHPVHEEITAPVHYLPEYLHQEPLRVLRAWWQARRMAGYRQALRQFWRDLRRDFTRNRLRRFGQGLVIAAEYAPGIDLFYAHFIHTPASATRYGATIAGRRFAISAHAKDIWTSPGWELAEKLADAQWCVTCTRGGKGELDRHDGKGKVSLVYHGIDLARFPPFTEKKHRRDGSAQDDPVILLTVGRAVAKKGLGNLLEALARLPDGLAWRWIHIGGGPDRPALQGRASELGIDQRCEFRGALPQSDVLAAYRAADLFILPSRIDETGDRDGLPNVLIEAQSQGLAVVTTPISGIPELVEDGLNGQFVQPDDPAALAEAIADLMRDPDRREKLGKAGEAKVRREFDHLATIGRLEALLTASLSDKARQPEPA